MPAADVAVDLLTIAVAVGIVAVLRERVDVTSQADSAYIAPWVTLGRRLLAFVRTAGRRTRYRAGRVWAFVRRRKPVGQTINVSAAGISTSAGSATVTVVSNVDQRIDAVQEQVAALDARVDEVENRLREEVASGDRATLVRAIGPSEWDCVVTGLALAAGLAVFVDLVALAT